MGTIWSQWLIKFIHSTRRLGERENIRRSATVSPFPKKMIFFTGQSLSEDPHSYNMFMNGGLDFPHCAMPYEHPTGWVGPYIRFLHSARDKNWLKDKGQKTNYGTLFSAESDFFYTFTISLRRRTHTYTKFSHLHRWLDLPRQPNWMNEYSLGTMAYWIHSFIQHARHPVIDWLKINIKRPPRARNTDIRFLRLFFSSLFFRLRLTMSRSSPTMAWCKVPAVDLHHVNVNIRKHRGENVRKAKIQVKTRRGRKGVINVASYRYRDNRF